MSRPAGVNPAPPTAVEQHAPAAAPRTGRRHHKALRLLVLVPLGAYFLLPAAAMLEFSTREAAGHHGGRAWAAIAETPELISAIITSVSLAGLTSAAMLMLLVPTVVWVRLRLPRLRRLVEFLCLLPLMIPAIVLVVGIAPVYAWVAYFLGDSPLTLTFVYVVLVLPYSYRAVDAGLGAIDLPTLAEAARGLGASWAAVLLRVVVPNIRGALVGASFLSVALVLGEFTLASLLNFRNLQVEITLLGENDAELSVAVSLAAILFAFLLLLVISFVGWQRRDRGPR
ncbi:ABC transporter permease [Streptomyces sp. NBC_00347]|uniref:ABC transporter permease n=1 Tax=Streptomyces sp. NBC_00347 TaxID=2975721 RepID=UPI00224E76FF|nr:ABC transporter permease subunit [Streptomyces sp. NBC_00347]MCX5126703.1 ABC transporter permease subunit [Streptomyces sp. NBC_00347]